MAGDLKEMILKTMETKEWYLFEDLLKGKRKKRYLLYFEEVLGDLSRPLQTGLWNSLYEYCIQLHHKQQQLEDVLDPMDVDEDRSQPNRSCYDDTSLKVVLAIASITLTLLKSNNGFFPEKLLDFIVYWGNNLAEVEGQIQKEALHLCEEWVLMEYPRFEYIQRNTMIVLVGLSLSPLAKAVDVKRVWGMKKALPDLLSCCKQGDTDDPIKSLVISCAEDMVYLCCDEGIKFLAGILSMPECMDDFHKVVKKSLPNCTNSQSSKYAEVYFRAWKTSGSDVKKLLEEKCLQDFMYAAIYIDPQTNLAGNLKSFLQYIHDHKKHLPTAAVIYMLYEPFIWRSLKVANGYVRQNATELFCDAFPFSSAGNNEEEEALLEQQYKAILDLLVDPCHLVRNAAITGSFHILGNYWRLLPAHVIQQMFQIYITKLLRDASNPSGRKNIIIGFSKLLDCAEAFTFMSNILPRISASCDDVSAHVRIAYIELLLRIKSSRHMKYWKLTPMNHLLHLLDQDVSTRPFIVKLIHNSFIPEEYNEKEWLQRTIWLVNSDRGAARSFYQHASKNIDLESTTRFLLCIWRTVFRYVKLSRERQDISINSSAGENTKENDSLQANLQVRKQTATVEKDITKDNIDPTELEESLPLDNPDVTAGLIDIIAIVWTINTGRFNEPANEKYIDVLRKRIASSFPRVWSFFKKSEVSNTLLYLSSLLPRSLATTMCGYCMSRLKEVSEIDSYDEAEANLYLTAICNWNCLDDIIQLITDWFTSTFESAETSSKSISNQKAKRVCFEESNPKPMVGLLFLKSLLRHRLNRLCALHKNRPLMLDLCRCMFRVKDLIVKRILANQRLSPICTDEFILKCYEDFMIFRIVLETGRKTDNEAGGEIDGDEGHPNRPIIEVFEEDRQFMEQFFDECPREEENSFGLSCLVTFLQSTKYLIATGNANVDLIKNLIAFAEKIFDKCMDCASLYKAAFDLLKEADKHMKAYYISDCKSQWCIESLQRIMNQSILPGQFATTNEETKKIVMSGIVSVFHHWNLDLSDLRLIMGCVASHVVNIVVQRFEEEGFEIEALDFLVSQMCFEILKKVSRGSSANALYSILSDPIKDHSFSVEQILAMLYILTVLGDQCRNKYKNILFAATKDLLCILENSDQIQPVSFRICLDKSRALLDSLQNKAT